MAFSGENILSGFGPEPFTLYSSQGARPKLKIVLVDPNKQNSLLNALETLSDYDNESYANWAATGGKVVVGAREHFASSNLVFTAEANPEDATSGAFSFKLPAEGSEEPGVFVFEASLFNKDDELILSNNGYLEVAASAAFRSKRSMPLSIAYLRRMVRDAHPEGNRILEECEFSIAEIMDCFSGAVEEFNNMPPILSTRYTLKTFPWTVNLYDGALARLYEMAAVWYERNDLKVSQAGLTADDMGKGAAYIAVSDRYRRRWVDWAKQVRRQLNIEGGWGTVGSSIYY